MRQQQTAKLAALKADIAEGLASGPAEPLDMKAIKVEARRQLRGKEGDSKRRP